MQQEIPQRREGGGRRRDLSGASIPFISIVIVTFQACRDLPPLLESIFPFQNDDVELVIVDGGSTDGTVDVLYRFDSKIDYWVSEPDRGIYDAMMKGIERSHGSFIFHLNAGDLLVHMPIDELRAAEREKIDIVSFRVKINTGEIFRPSNGRLLRYRNTLHHQGTFYRRASFIGYNCDYKVFADFDLNQRMVFSGANVRFYDRIVASHSTDGISNHTGTNEVFSIIRKNCGNTSVFISYVLFKWSGLGARFHRWMRRVS